MDSRYSAQTDIGDETIARWKSSLNTNNDI